MIDSCFGYYKNRLANSNQCVFNLDHFLHTKVFPKYIISSLELSITSTASFGVQTIGEPCRLREVLRTAPIPVSFSNSLIRSWYSWFVALVTIWGLAVRSAGCNAAISSFLASSVVSN